MNEENFKSLTRLITQKLTSLPEIVHAQIVHIFWPLLKNREFDTRLLIQKLTSEGKQCVLPRVLFHPDAQQDHPRMEHCLFSGETNLRANRWDVYEPVSTKTVPVSALDVVVAPALAVDMYGIRLGYGKGYYDEFLSQVTCPTYALYLMRS